eukprot:282087_1
MASVFCIQCGVKNKDIAQYCFKCGATLEHQPPTSTNDIPQSTVAVSSYLLSDMDKESMKTILNDESTEFNPFFTTRQGKCCPLCWQPCVSILLFALMIIPGIVGSFMVPSPLWIILSALGVVFLILQFYHFTKIEVGYLIVGDKEFVMMKRTKCSMRSQCYLP